MGTSDELVAQMRKLRREAGLTQADLGTMCGRTQACISQVESGRRGSPRLDTVLGMLAPLGKTLRVVDVDG